MDDPRWSADLERAAGSSRVLFLGLVQIWILVLLGTNRGWLTKKVLVCFTRSPGPAAGNAWGGGNAVDVDLGS
jgi:hypothetical protein